MNSRLSIQPRTTTASCWMAAMIAEPPPIDSSDSGTKTRISARSVSSRMAQARRQASATLSGAITSTTGISGQRSSPTQIAVTAMTTRPGGNRLAR